MRHTPQRRFVDMLMALQVSDVDTFAGIEQVNLEPWMVYHLRQVEAGLRRLRQGVEQRMAGDTRTCPRCDAVVVGRSDRIFCSAACRQDHYRWGGRTQRSEQRRTRR